MQTAIAISFGLVAASAGTGFGLSAVHKATFEPAAVAILSAPQVDVAPEFVIPQYAPNRIQVPEAIPAVVQVPEAPVAVEEFAVLTRPKARPVNEFIRTIPHDREPVIASVAPTKVPSRQTLTTFERSYEMPVVTQASAPVIVTQVSARDISAVARTPEYAHGVYR